MMKHYIVVKLVPGADVDAAEKKIRQTYEAMDALLPYVRNLSVRRNCVSRQSNADFMISLELDGEECLQSYLTHPLHMQMAKEMESQVALRISFDHM